jgi:hypothetical protein
MSNDPKETAAPQTDKVDVAACPPDRCRIVPPKVRGLNDPIEQRAESAKQLRIDRANILRNQPLPQEPLCNGDEKLKSLDRETEFIAMYSKGLAHLDTGEVEPGAYCALLDGLRENSVKGFDGKVGPHLGCEPTTDEGRSQTAALMQISPEATAVGNQMRLINPLSAQTYELMGIDPQQVQLFDWGKFNSDNSVARINFPTPPKFGSSEVIAEMAEVYWMALCRDVPFLDYRPNSAGLVNPIVDAAAWDLANFTSFYDRSAYTYPPVVNAKDPNTLFRGFTRGDDKGPYVSQFLVRPVPIAAITGDPRLRSLRPVRNPDGTPFNDGRPPNDYLVNFDQWLSRQKGCRPGGDPSDSLLPGSRLPLTGRDLGQYVHVDIPLEEFLNACFIISTPQDATAPLPLGLRLAPPLTGNPIGGGMSDSTGYNLFGAGNPYKPGPPPPTPCPGSGSTVQDGFGTLGKPDLKVLIAEAALRAFRAAWYQKWSIHRRLRPEEFGGRIDVQKHGKDRYPFHGAAFTQLEQAVLREIAAYNKTYLGADNSYLLPQAYPEGCPMHPSYPQGHATVAGAAVTILKAFTCDANLVEQGITIVEPLDASTLKEYNGPDKKEITLHGELNKLASNVGLARDFVGVHYRSDYINGLLLGETVAVWLLCDIRETYAEDFFFEFETFSRKKITIDKKFTDCFKEHPDHIGGNVL